MTGIYTLKVRTEFSAAHALRGYVGDCARIHGHNWKIDVVLKTSTLNEIGIGVDFKDIKKQINEIKDILEHQYINEISPFDKINPTAENISAWFYKNLKAIETDNVKLKSVEIYETDRASVTYSEE